MVVQDGLDQGQQSEPLDDRIADLERSIRGELAMQVQTQLAALRGSLPSSQPPQDQGCLAGDLEDGLHISFIINGLVVVLQVAGEAPLRLWLL